MRTANYVLGFCLLSTSVAMMACTGNAPANGNQPVANSNTANASQSNAAASKPSAPAVQSTTGSIEVTSTPPGARVLLVPVDEGGAGAPQSKGVTPTTVTGLAPGKYTVDLEKTGYRFAQKDVVVKAGRTVKVTATLKKN